VREAIEIYEEELFRGADGVPIPPASWAAARREAALAQDKFEQGMSPEM
jgi:hypothetical protein